MEEERGGEIDRGVYDPKQGVRLTWQTYSPFSQCGPVGEQAGADLWHRKKLGSTQCVNRCSLEAFRCSLFDWLGW